MSDRLLLFAPAGDHDPWRYCLIPEGQRDPVLGVGLEAAATQPAASEGTPEVLLVVPGEQVLRTAIQVPARRRRQLQMAAPYLVEEYLAEDVEQLHLALGTRRADGRIPVAVIDPSLLESWLTEVTDAGLEVSRAHSDVDGLDQGDAHIRVQVDAQRALIATSLGQAMAIDRTLLQQTLASLLADHEAEEPVHIRLVADETDVGLDLAELDSALAQLRPVTIEREPATMATLEMLGRNLPSSDGVDLLQGPFAVARATPGGWRRWQLVAGLALTWVVLQLGLDYGRAAWLEQRTAALREESMAMFRDIHPQRTRVPDPRRELQAMLEGGGAGGNAAFLELLGAAASHLAELTDAEARLRSLTFNAQRGDLALDLYASGIATVDRFKEGMDASGYPVVIDSAVQESESVRARVRVRAGGAS